MLTTEQEAKGKWCPMVRMPMITDSGRGPDAATAINTTPDGARGPASGTNCIGRRCMMWRWMGRPSANNITGYCGIAGTGPQGIGMWRDDS